MDLPRGLRAVRRRPPLKADPFAQQQLLKLQAVDAKLHQLQHQRAHIAEQIELVALAAERVPVENKVRDAQIVVDDLAVELRKAEMDVEQVKIRRDRDTKRMDAGLISSPKDLARMQTELVSLERRVNSLEESQLDVMEQSEAAQAELKELGAELEGLDAKGAELAAARDARAAEIDAEIAEHEANRAAETLGIGSELLKLYDRLREQKGGVGASELRQRQCNGCMLTLDNAELALIKAKPSDEVVRCEECSRILVRTPESGL